MQSNNVLDFRRLGYYFQYHILASWKSYLLGALSIFGLLMLVPAFMLLTDNSPRELSEAVGFYYFGLFFGGLLFTSMAFSELASKEKGAQFLMLPASHFEKFITIFLVTTVGYLLVYHIAAYAALLFLNKVSLIRNEAALLLDWSFLSKEDGHVYIYYAYIFCHALFLLGAVFFSRLAFIKTLVATLVCLAALYLLNTLLVWILFAGHMPTPFQNVPFLLVGVHDGLYKSNVYVISEKMINSYIFIAQYLLAPALWTIAYFRLKDKEI